MGIVIAHSFPSLRSNGCIATLRCGKLRLQGRKIRSGWGRLSISAVTKAYTIVVEAGDIMAAQRRSGYIGELPAVPEGVEYKDGSSQDNRVRSADLQG